MCSQAGVSGTGTWRVMAFWTCSSWFLAWNRLLLRASWSRRLWIGAIVVAILVSSVTIVAMTPRKCTVATIPRMVRTATGHGKRTIVAGPRFVHTTSRNELAKHPRVFRADKCCRSLLSHVGLLLLLLLGWFLAMDTVGANGSLCRRGGSKLGY